MKCTIRSVVVALAALALWVVPTGCGSGHPKAVPADATSVAKQTGTKPFNFIAPRDGTVYVYDRTAKQMVYSGRVRRGETLELDPKRDELRLEGRVVMDKDMRDLNKYQVWFDEEIAPTAAAMPAAATPAGTTPAGTTPAGTTPAGTTSPSSN